MIITGVIVLQLVHHLAVSLLFGLSLFPLYALGGGMVPARGAFGWLPRMLVYAGVMAVGSQALLMALTASASGPALMRVSMARLVLALGIAALLLLKPTRARAYGVLIGSGVLVASLSEMGRAGGGTGVAAAVHIFTDAMHLIAASIWMGALFAFVLVLMDARRTRAESNAAMACRALDRFSEVGSIVVVVLVFTGLANPNVATSFSTPYGQILLTKLALFAAMLGLAGANRFWLTPWLASELVAKSGRETSLRALHVSILTETVLAVLVFATVAALGVLSPRGP